MFVTHLCISHVGLLKDLPKMIVLEQKKENLKLNIQCKHFSNF